MAVEYVKADFSRAAAVCELIRELAAALKEDSPITEEFVRAYLELPSSRILLALEDGRPIGMASYSLRPSLFHGDLSCVIEDVVVRGPWRGKGIGSALLRRVLDDAVALECVEASVTTEKDNTRAISLYKGLGLVEEFLYLEKHFRSQST